MSLCDKLIVHTIKFGIRLIPGFDVKVQQLLVIVSHIELIAASCEVENMIARSFYGLCLLGQTYSDPMYDIPSHGQMIYEVEGSNMGNSNVRKKSYQKMLNCN